MPHPPKATLLITPEILLKVVLKTPITLTILHYITELGGLLVKDIDF
jgi:hypothetical protein